jgi:hypothetical protein
VVEGWNGTAWSIQATPNPPGSNGNLIGLSCLSGVACTAVGQGLNPAGDPVPLAEVWKGTSWSIQSTPARIGVRTAELNAVSCTSATACTAVGSFGSYYPATGTSRSSALAERWDGTSWSIQSVPSPPNGQDSTLSAVSCSSTTACTAVGSAAATPDAIPEPFAEHWDGTGWSVQTIPAPTGEGNGGAFLNAVSCTSATACTAVGSFYDVATDPITVQTVAARWDGTSWSVQSTPVPSGGADTQLRGVSCTSATVCIAVGDQGNGNGGPLAERWDGTTWSIQSTPAPTSKTGSELNAVSCTSATSCIAVGDTGNAGLMVAERWNGTSWSLQSTPKSFNYPGLTDVSCASATACTAVGTSDRGLLPMVARWDGTTWGIGSMAKPPSGFFELFVRGVSCTATTLCTAVGSTIYATGAASLGGAAPLAEQYS